MGFEKPTPIQEKAIPLILDKKNLIACAQTGTGKTAAFILPVLHNLLVNGSKGINTLVLAPTRELAMQIDQQIEGFSYFTNATSIAVYGGGDGQTWVQQKRALAQGADIIIATPGRLISFLGSDKVDFSSLKHLILDEADRMLDMGFFDDLMKIIKQLPEKRQNLLFSATMPPNIKKLASKIMPHYEEVAISISKPAEGINQQAYMTHDSQKEPLLLGILRDKTYKSVIVFASTKEKVKNLTRSLKKQGEEVRQFHSDLEQIEREKLMQQFKGKNVRILVGTDILSRGIDVEGIDLIVNYDVPPDPEDYVHRIGRTARAESTGTAITFINDKDIKRFMGIEKLIEKAVPKLDLPKELGRGPDYKDRPRSSHRGGRSKGGGGKSKSRNFRKGRR
nr:DEAD/DEAH box helicase [Saprospiraceae bacterium]